MKTDLKTLFEIAGIADQPKAIKLIKENFDDEQAYVMDFYQKNKSKLSDQQRQQFNRLDSLLRDAYENEDESADDYLDAIRDLLGIRGRPVL